jgi:hypothetical protein
MCEGIVSGEMHHHVALSSPHGPLGLMTISSTSPAAATGAPTAETATTMAHEESAVASGHGASADGAKKQPTQQDVPCFPACMEMDNQKEVRIAAQANGGDGSKAHAEGEESAALATSSGRRSRRNSRRLSMDNQLEATGSLDLEDVARGVLSPVDTRSQAPAPGSIVVDYDEGMPERSRTGLLLRYNDEEAATAAADCAPGACDPLDALVFDGLALEDMASSVAWSASRPRLGSASQPPKTPRSPKTPSRRGKTVVLSSSSVAVEPEIEKPLVAVDTSTTVPPVAKPNGHIEKKEEEEEEPERCSQLHKLCLCEVRLHKSRESCWLVASGSVYDVTGLVDVHPAGPRSILRKAGGADCTKDMKFHSKAARKMMQKCFIGKLVPCGDDPDPADAPAACTIM